MSQNNSGSQTQATYRDVTLSLVWAVAWRVLLATLSGYSLTVPPHGFFIDMLTAFNGVTYTIWTVYVIVDWRLKRCRV